jgi:hypothetical protein
MLFGLACQPFKFSLALSVCSLLTLAILKLDGEDDLEGFTVLLLAKTALFVGAKR